MNNRNKAFTFIEILVGLSVSAAIFMVATSLVVNIFSSSLKGRQVELLAQVKNDLQAEFGNTVRWADSISHTGGILQIDAIGYRLEAGRLYKNDLPLTPKEVEITKFEISKFDTQTGAGSVQETGSGLTSQYFNNANFTEIVFTQTDFSVDFDWGVSSPDELIDPNTFSVRFTGQVEAEVPGEHTFYVASDEGARLWVDNTLVIDDWNIPGFSEVPGRVDLSPGKHDIRLDYFDNFGGARVALSWAYPGTSKRVIPTANLFPKSGPVSLEIVVEMRLTSNPSAVDTLSLTLSPRSGTVDIVE